MLTAQLLLQTRVLPRFECGVNHPFMIHVLTRVHGSNSSIISFQPNKETVYYTVTLFSSLAECCVLSFGMGLVPDFEKVCQLSVRCNAPTKM